MTQLRCVFIGNGMLSRAETVAAMTLFGEEALPGCHECATAAAGAPQYGERQAGR